MAWQYTQNTVKCVLHPPAVLILSPENIGGWCQQFSQEGYDVYHLTFPVRDESLINLAQELKSKESPFAILTYGLPDSAAAEALGKVSQSLVELGLKASVHYSPAIDDGTCLLVKNFEGRYLPSNFHFASSQEKLHASLLPLADQANLQYKLKPSEYPPISAHPYPLVPAYPAFPLLARAPAAVVPGLNIAVDPYVLSATNISYTKTLDLLRREIGPRFDLEKIWAEHTYYEFVVRSASKTMATMVEVPYVNHIATLTGGVGYDNLARFYKYHFTSETVTPPDTEIITVSRTIGADRIIDEMIFKCTHTTEIDYFLPNIKPTGKPLELALVGVIAFRGDKLCFEHIYWDQASALVQLGLLDPNHLPVAGKEVAQKVLDPFGQPSNRMMKRWSESEGLRID